MTNGSFRESPVLPCCDDEGSVRAGLHDFCTERVGYARKGAPRWGGRAVAEAGVQP
jgi:hypothetical protein